jgi:hypothetical protein
MNQRKIKLVILTFFICAIFSVVWAHNFLEQDRDSFKKELTSALEDIGTADNNYQPTPKQAQKVLSKAKNSIKKLDKTRQVYYEEFFNKIKTLNGLPDVKDVDTMKAYLAAYKLLKYDLNPPIDNRADCFNEDSSVLGSTSMAFAQMYRKHQKDPAYLWLEKELYTTDHFKMLPMNRRQKVEEISNALMQQRLQKRFGWDKTQLDSFLEEATGQFRNVTFRYTTDTDNEWNNWTVNVSLLPNGVYEEESGKFFPRSLCALHELLHVQDTFPGEGENYEQPLGELSTSIQDIVLSDFVYKQLNDIDLMEEVSYPQQKKAVDYGKLAVFFHEMLQKYGEQDITPLLSKPEVEEYIHSLYQISSCCPTCKNKLPN